MQCKEIVIKVENNISNLQNEDFKHPFISKKKKRTQYSILQRRWYDEIILWRIYTDIEASHIRPRYFFNRKCTMLYIS